MSWPEWMRVNSPGKFQLRTTLKDHQGQILMKKLDFFNIVYQSYQTLKSVPLFSSRLMWRTLNGDTKGQFLSKKVMLNVYDTHYHTSTPNCLSSLYLSGVWLDEIDSIFHHLQISKKDVNVYIFHYELDTIAF